MHIFKLNTKMKNFNKEDNLIEIIFEDDFIIVINADKTILAGHTRYFASKKLELKQVPCVIAELNDTKQKAYRIADNRTNEEAEWNDDLLRYDNGKKIFERAKTIFKVIDKNSNSSLVEMKPITGRKHQLRKQLAFMGNPIVGDSKYNIIKHKKKSEKKLMLHAYKIKFMINNKKYNFEARPPDYFNNYLNKKRLIV